MVCPFIQLLLRWMAPPPCPSLLRRMPRVVFLPFWELGAASPFLPLISVARGLLPLFLAWRMLLLVLVCWQEALFLLHQHLWLLPHWLARWPPHLDRRLGLISARTWLLGVSPSCLLQFFLLAPLLLLLAPWIYHLLPWAWMEF